MRKSAAVAAIVTASLGWAATSRADGPSTSPIRPIGPKQFFEGMVNGTPGSGVIALVCPRPSTGTPARFGHPVAGQSVSVHQLFPPAVTPSGLGFTGAASTISAALLVPSPSAASAAAVQPIPLAVFAYYDDRVPIPTTLTLPCGGSGVVVFDPVQGGAAAHAYREPVKLPFISAASG